MSRKGMSKKGKLNELLITNLEVADELLIANKENADELIVANIEKAKRAKELVIANVEKAKRAAELVIAKVKKAKRAAELVIANKELAFQNSEKQKRAAELVIAKVEKQKRAAELVMANVEKQKRAAELVIAKVEKAKHAAELVMANKELAFQNSEKQKRAAELVIAKVEKAKRAAELVIANVEKAKRAAELISAKIEKAKSAAELVIANEELVLANKQEKLAKEKYIELYNFAPAGYLTLSIEGKIIEINLSGANMLGIKRQLIKNRMFGFFVSDDTKSIFNLFLKKVFNSKANETCEVNLSTNSDLQKCVRLICIASESGKQCLVNMVDITERNKTELELIKAKEKAEESDRLKSAFLTNMSHEIRTPMNGILGFTELLKEPNLSSDDQKDFIQTIQISGERMLNTINNIVDISKIESGLIQIDIKETYINQKIEFIYKFFKPEVEIKGLKFLFKNGLPSKEAIINTDNEKVYAILTNLVKNAIKFTYDGSIEFGYEKKGEYLEFFVKDTGIGIPQIQHQMIFERFRQGSESHNRGYEGSGLGLSICKSYVEMLGGKVWVKSEEGKGSTFYFTIPYNAVSEEKIELISAVSSEHKEVETKKLKVLIVEDDEISYSLLTRTLQKISKEVLHAVTGVEAVEACRNNPDLDLVLMDIRMPIMDGNEATRQIRQFNKDIIILAQTAYAFSGDKEKALKAGCNDYISKPINKAVLYELIKKHCNK
jgi:signal transduction histidine kinase/ActR/RegA family two-component response regulator